MDDIDDRRAPNARRQAAGNRAVNLETAYYIKIWRLNLQRPSYVLSANFETEAQHVPSPSRTEVATMSKLHLLTHMNWHMESMALPLQSHSLVWIASSTSISHRPLKTTCLPRPQILVTPLTGDKGTIHIFLFVLYFSASRFGG